jgi:hypothetical protein
VAKSAKATTRTVKFHFTDAQMKRLKLGLVTTGLGMGQVVGLLLDNFALSVEHHSAAQTALESIALQVSVTPHVTKVTGRNHK